jgi:hypothetical protein
LRKSTKTETTSRWEVVRAHAGLSGVRYVRITRRR